MIRDLELELSVAHNALREVGREDLIERIQIKTIDGNTDIYVKVLELLPSNHDASKALEAALLISHQVHDKTAHYVECPSHPPLLNLHCDACYLAGEVCEKDIYDY